ncbi:hypothetical protein MXB_2586 [Myxobolus squamalis]|nr:hypothetical protein MXB_2586 [Myxobolus squamalis]
MLLNDTGKGLADTLLYYVPSNMIENQISIIQHHARLNMHNLLMSLLGKIFIIKIAINILLGLSSRDQIIIRQLTYFRIEQLKNYINENITKLNLLAKTVEQINSGQPSSMLNDGNIEINSDKFLKLVYQEMHNPNFESADSLKDSNYQNIKNIPKIVTPQISPKLKSFFRRIHVPQSLQEPIGSISCHGSPLKSDTELTFGVSALEYSSGTS